MKTFAVRVQRSFLAIGVGALVVVGGGPLARTADSAKEKEERSRIAAANLEDALVVDCQLPGKLQKLGGMRTYLTPGRLLRLSAVDCRARGGEYTIADLSSGTLSIQRWLPLAESGEAEAQYYVARIYANGMGGIAVDHTRAADWYQRAANQNYSAAIQELGYLYEQGLGVQKDPVLALNLQRKAAGLGKELDYAWKITAAEEEGARQVAALSEQLEASNTELETLRAKVLDTTNAAFQARQKLARSESAVLDLRQQLTVAKQSGDGGGSKVAELRGALTAKEDELSAARGKMEALTAQLNDQETQLSTRLAQSQASSLELNELLTGERAKNQELAARLAQADQRLLRSEHELSGLRAQYRAEVEQLVAERDDLEQASTKSKDETAALLVARERDLERQRLRVTSLEKALADAKRPQVDTARSASADALQASVTSLRTQLEEQQKLVKERERQIESIRARAKEDRFALMRDFDAQLAKRTQEIEAKLRRLTALTSETNALRSEVLRLNQERDRGVGVAADDASRARASLRRAQQKLSEQRERLDQLQTEKATETAALAQARDELRRQLTANNKASEMQVAFLRKDLEARQKDIEAKDAQIVSLDDRLQEQSKRYDALMAQTFPSGNAIDNRAVLASAQAPPATAPGVGKMRSADSRPVALQHSLAELRQSSTDNYHAIVIGNSLYHYMETLDTPTNDAKVIAQLLSERYGFKVRLLLDATREQIMLALHDAKRTLTPQDNLLIYYAGHGDVDAASGRAFWLGVEADRDTRSGWLEADHIRAKIKEMSAKHVLLVADSCFSGAITHPKTTTIGRGLNETRLRVQWSRRARMVLTSGEVTPVADSAGDGTHSVFARYFIQVLRQNDNVMSGEMLSHELSGRMLAQPIQVGKNGQRQRPTYSTLQDANHDIGDFFFVPVAAPAKVAALNY